MTDEQIETMLKMHRYLIHCEISYLVYKMSENDHSADLQTEVNDGHWDNFAKWLRCIRDD